MAVSYDSIEPPGGVSLVRSHPLWRWSTVVLRLVFIFSLFAVWLVQTRGCQRQILHDPVPLTGWQLLNRTDRPPVMLGYAVMGLCIVAAAVAGAARRRQTLVAAAGRGTIRIFGSCALLLALLAFPIHQASVWAAGYDLAGGFVMGAGAIGLVVMVELVRLAGMAPAILSHLRSSAPWRWISLPAGVILALDLLWLVVVLLAATVDLVEAIARVAEHPEDLTAFRFIAFVIVQASSAACMASLAAAGWGLLARQRWAAWSHLAVAAFLFGLVALVRGSNIVLPDWARLLVPPWKGWWGVALLGLLAAWGVAAWVLGVIRSGGLWQRGVCWSCGRRYLRAIPRCPVCGERFHVARDRVAPDVCLACGHEDDGRPSKCPACWRDPGPSLRP